MIGVLCFVDVSYGVSRAALFMSLSVAIGVLCIPALLFIFTSCFIFVKYCIRDNGTNRRHLVVGTSLMIFANAYLLVLWFAAAMFLKEVGAETLLSVSVTYVFNIAIWFYFRMTCQQWVTLGDMIGIRDHNAQAQAQHRENAYRTGEAPPQQVAFQGGG